ncbi:site-specific integrase [Methylorubrum sp. Q1]|uniref:site-specific integrase n=1 Tax=Methylorubrum sp. Q1 TaxID=2562453 RepID=UPI00187D534B|nr:site-specific integrase [Methylorubrum sp. Q1]
MAHQPNLTERNGTFYLRMRVPLDVVEAVGRTHVVVSLKTKERRVALTRFRLEQARVERQFEAARQQATDTAALRRSLASGRLEKLAPGEVEGLALRWFEHAVQRVARTSRNTFQTGSADWDAVLAELKAEGDVLTSPDPQDFEPTVRHTVDHLLLAAGAPPEPIRGRIQRRVRRPQVDEDTAQYQQLAALVRRGLVALNRDRLAQLTGAGEGAIAVSSGGLEVLGVRPRRSLDELIRAFTSDPGRGSRTAKTETDYRMVFAALREVIGGETDVSRITRDHMRRLRDLFRTLPPNATKRFRGRTLTQAAEVAVSEGLPALSTKTVNGHLTMVSTLFNWAVREEWVERSPASGLTIEAGQKITREPFSSGHLKAIFAAPLFVGCQNDGSGYAQPGPNQPRGARFWVPLIALFHGLRLNEACQLRPDDIAERDGFPVIHVRAADASQKVKSRAGTRIVPLHPEIIACGFLGFVAEARHQGHARLFHELSADARGYFSDAFQKWFSRFLASRGIAQRGASFHSFRHGWADRLREAGVPEDRRRALGGWADTGVDGSYGRGFPTKMLAEDVGKVEYPGLDLKFLHIQSFVNT